ncbi:hypothetical protein BBM40_22595 [Vibrio parahaemolyticus]|uniref:hypothetical protein n=1 Tax=Vibrio parahaemolyticus TaxID=670 RepID=UPI00084AE91E|nr:hypothetical protein [Vibrio parahaemolyticus]ODZ44047.1 hypothetical protein BBM40_22595 [Vibrio parahaemolyticus]HCG7969477.1 hypothetical protein [Vibrio parahaemolyticus]HCH2845199.1 hypothetical protein [Vibrio parahaemolyticus]
MINLQAKDQCPQYVYKYCTQEVYEKHILHGEFKLGTLAEYRRAYELDGAGFGDPREGNHALFVKGPTLLPNLNTSVNAQGGVVDNALILSVSSEYSEEAHLKWFKRKGCGYDLCIKYRAEDLFFEIADRLRFRIPWQREFFIGEPIYNNGNVDPRRDSYHPCHKYFFKSRELAWEKEYRLVCCTPYLSSHQAKSVFPIALKTKDMIEDVIHLQVRT